MRPSQDGPTRGAPDAVPRACLAAFGLVWALLAIAPRSRDTWLLENLMTFAIVPLLVATYRSFRFSDRAYVLATFFLVLHTLGSHYDYSEVPVGAWLSGALGLSRNHYDRLVHFAFGLLLFPANRELAFGRRRRLPIRRELALTVAVTAWWSVLYELIEWRAALIVAPDAGAAFLGTQGDEWDAQKDMALACLGAVTAALVVLARGAATRRSTARRVQPTGA